MRWPARTFTSTRSGVGELAAYTFRIGVLGILRGMLAASLSQHSCLRRLWKDLNRRRQAHALPSVRCLELCNAQPRIVIAALLILGGFVLFDERGVWQEIPLGDPCSLYSLARTSLGFGLGIFMFRL